MIIWMWLLLLSLWRLMTTMSMRPFPNLPWKPTIQWWSLFHDRKQLTASLKHQDLATMILSPDYSLTRSHDPWPTPTSTSAVILFAYSVIATTSQYCTCKLLWNLQLKLQSDIPKNPKSPIVAPYSNSSPLEPMIMRIALSLAPDLARRP